MFINWIIFAIYSIALILLSIYSLHGFIMVFYRWKYQTLTPATNSSLIPKDIVTIQLPIYNEKFVVERLIKSILSLDYPKELLQIQILDDSNDETSNIIRSIIKHATSTGFDIVHIQRTNRIGFKAGALAEGLKSAKGKYIAIFDADFIPKPSFLMDTLPYFVKEKNIAVVQKRWSFINEHFSFLTKLQAYILNGHFALEQNVRFKSNFFFNFNGTGGVWLKEAILNSGGWQFDTITEDLDLSYRAQLKNYKFIYLINKTIPSELPVNILSLKAQQYRWTKGAIETAKKIVAPMLKSKQPIRVKLQGLFHLSNNIVFPIVLLLALLNLPLEFVKQYQPFKEYFNYFGYFIIPLFSTFVLYFFAQKDAGKKPIHHLFTFPLFLVASMGLSVNNSKAVIEAILGIKSPFVRTPKFNFLSHKDSLPKNRYLAELKNSTIILAEFFMFTYCLVTIIISISFGDYLAIPFQVLFCSGFGAISIISIKHSIMSRKF